MTIVLNLSRKRIEKALVDPTPPLPARDEGLAYAVFYSPSPNGEGLGGEVRYFFNGL